MANMIASLGRDWFNERFAGAMFVHEDRAYKLVGAMGTKVVARDLASQEEKQIPNEEFPGFKKFSYPKLGYRRIDNHLAAFCIKTQSAKRGLAIERVDFSYSPASCYLFNEGLAHPPQFQKLGQNVMLPKFDTKADIEKLLEFKRLNVVLNESLLIEASVRDEAGFFDVYYNQARVARMLENGKVNYSSDNYKRLIEPMIRV